MDAYVHAFYIRLIDESCLERTCFGLNRKQDVDDERRYTRVERERVIQIATQTRFVRFVFFNNRYDLVGDEVSKLEDGFAFEVDFVCQNIDRLEHVVLGCFVDRLLVLDVLDEASVETPVQRVCHTAKIGQVVADDTEFSAEEFLRQ